MNRWESRPAQQGVWARSPAHPSVTEIGPHLLIGEYPRPDDIGWLKESFGITAVLSLQDDQDLRFHLLDLNDLSDEYQARGIRFVRVPIQDGSMDAMSEHLETALSDLHSLIAANQRVYLHCNAGVNRSPTLAIAYLHAHRGMSLDEALTHVRSRRACVPSMIVLEEYFSPLDARQSSARADQAVPLSRPATKQRILTACAWGVHLYTGLGAVFGLLAIHYAAFHEFRASFVAMAAATGIDASDGTLARLVNVKANAPALDGTLLDNIVDYLTYVIAPVFLMLNAGIVPAGVAGLALACFVTLASAYQFCQTDAKTPDNYFLGFPSYWNLTAFYLYCLRFPVVVNSIILALFGVMVFIPIKYIYPSRTRPLRPLTVTLGIVWAGVTLAMLPELPRYNPILLSLSLAYVAYYLLVSFALHARALMARVS